MKGNVDHSRRRKKLFKDSNRVIEYETLLFAYSSWLHSYNETKV